MTDHVALALSRLPHMYRGADSAHETNTQKVIRALLSPAADLESAMQQVLTERSIDTAVGVQLTALGKLVGMERQGVTDDEIYRRFVRGAIAANKSDGLIDDIITIAKLMVNDVGAVFTLKNQGAAAFALQITGVSVTDAVAAVLIKLIRKAAGAAIRPILEYSTAAPSAVLLWDTQGVWDTAVWAAGLDSAVVPDAYPMSAAEMAAAVPGATFTHGWLCDETSGDLSPVFGGVTLTASGTGLIYGDAGPRGGSDHAIGFTAGPATGKFDSGSALFDIASNTDELVVAWVGKWSALPSSFGAMFGKEAAAAANGWAMSGTDGTVVEFVLGPTAAYMPVILGTSGYLIGQWHVGIAVIDRSGTDTARFGVRELFGSTTVLSTSNTGINGNTSSSATNFVVGSGDWVPGNDNFRLAALYIGKGAGVAAGLAANLSAALDAFAARIARNL